MSVTAHIEPLAGKLPSIVWRWDAETDILSGAFKTTRRNDGLNGTVELTDEAGSIAVLDVTDGCICGLDMVVWPEVSTESGLQVPAQRSEGRVVLPSEENGSGLASLEVNAPLAVTTNPEESVFHMRIGPVRPAEVIRVADHLFVEVDPQRELAGFWLTGVPPFPAGEDF